MSRLQRADNQMAIERPEVVKKYGQFPRGGLYIVLQIAILMRRSCIRMKDMTVVSSVAAIIFWSVCV